MRTLRTLRRLARAAVHEGHPLLRRQEPQRRPAHAGIVVVHVAVLSLFALHEVFHVLADGLGYGYGNALGALYGPHVAGTTLHISVGVGVTIGYGSVVVRGLASVLAQPPERIEAARERRPERSWEREPE